MTMLQLIVPCFNEAGRLRFDPWKRAIEQQEHLSLIFVDDGSSDQTASTLRAMCEAIGPRAAWMSLPTNQGKAEAVRRGMLCALDGGCEVTGYWDADLATSLDEVPRLLDVLRADDEVLVAMGSRVRLMGTSIHREPMRHYVGRSFATVASSMLGMSVYDTQCGAKLLRSCDPVKQALRSPFVSRWIFDVQLLARVVISSGSPEVIREVPVHAWRDVAGSKVRPSHMVRALLELRQMRGELGQARRISQAARAKTISDTPNGRST